MSLFFSKPIRSSLFSLFVFFLWMEPCLAQKKDSVVFAHDSTIVIEKKKDSTIKKRVYSPRAATLRSAILPGWGQIYNKKYWKLPIVYGALGVTAYVFFDNLQVYRDLRFTYKTKYNLSINPYNLYGAPYALPDSSDYYKIKPEYARLSLNSLRQNRDNFRRNIDYSVLVFILFWGLNVVDATVDAHLKGFDVSPDLSLKIKPYIYAGNSFGLSLVLKPKDKHKW
ncbi:MAG: hypothetical protein JST09_09680 [Bacteroidetes bacterium]|nr:hypothetical protein [Bacteroidota bacterium]